MLKCSDCKLYRCVHNHVLCHDCTSCDVNECCNNYCYCKDFIDDENFDASTCPYFDAVKPYLLTMTNITTKTMIDVCTGDDVESLINYAKKVRNHPDDTFTVWSNGCAVAKV